MDTFIIIIAVAVAALLIAEAVFSTRCLRITRVEIPVRNLPAEFDGCRFAHITDLHSASFGSNNRRLAAAVKKIDPVAVLATGDVCNGYDAEKPESSSFIRLCSSLSPLPVYLSLGNHETRLVYKHMDTYERLLSAFKAAGVVLLDNSSSVIKLGNSHINLFGLTVTGLRHSGHRPFKIPDGVFRDTLLPVGGEVNLLLAHIPQFFPEYAAAGYDLILSGHMHGGIVRLPLIGGVFSPERRLFPKYAYGLYERDGAKMFVGAGLGRALIPFRLFCRPEVAEIVLKCAE